MTIPLPKDKRVYWSLAALCVLLLVMMPRRGKFDYKYQRGLPWPYETLVAQFDFPILKTDEQIQSERDAAGDRVIPYYRYSEAAAQTVINGVRALDLGQYSYLMGSILNSLNSSYDKGVTAEWETYSRYFKPSGDDILFVHRDKRATRRPATDVYTISGVKSKLLKDVGSEAKGANLDSLFSSCGLYDLLAPDLIYDNETTQLIHAESADYISPTEGFVSSGQTIVSKGELVTAEVQQMLDSYKAEYENVVGYSGPRVLLFASNLGFALALTMLFFFAVLFAAPDEFSRFNHWLYICTVFMVAVTSIFLFNKNNPELLYLVPFTVTALFLLPFFYAKLVLPVYAASLVPLLIFTPNGTELYTMFLVAGAGTMYFFHIFRHGWKQFVNATITFVILALVFTSFRLAGGNYATFSRIVYLLVGSVMSVAAYPIVYIFEKAFGLLSQSRLKDLCDTNNNKLLVEMAQNAPGTFQHSVSVMNMAGTVANAIGADVALVRAGALYHDIGKMNNPQCFIENETMGDHYHDGLTPQESAKDIIRHVDDGMALAEKYNLPDVLREFIETHHGTSTTGYFYNKYVNAGGDPENKDDFTYHGKKPWTREQTILMVCDSVEAASRTLKDNKPETFNAFVDRIVSGKIESGQLSDSSLSVKDLGIMKNVLKSYLAQVYHGRVAYPKRKNG